MIDTHCHLCHPDYRTDYADVLAQAGDAGLRSLVNVGYDLASSGEAVAQSERCEWMWAAVGVHPHDAQSWDAGTGQELLSLARLPKVVAIGETGLDLYRNLSPVSTQEEVFRRLIHLARDVGLPLIIHDREAHEQTLAILDEENAGCVPVVMHCFSGDLDIAHACIDRGYLLGITGSITFPSAHRIRDVVRSVPLDSLLLETDCPYLAPQAFRGQRNEPAYLPLVAESLAKVKSLDPSEVRSVTTRTASAVFDLQLQNF